MRNSMMLLGGLSLLALTSSVARADEPARYAFGGRVGGYGFREAPGEDAERTQWNDCRMNGMGVFGQRSLGRNFFAEAGFDFYFSDNFPTGGAAEGTSSREVGADTMDRASGLASIAGGVRFFPTARISPYLQIGGGVELTKVSMPVYGMEDSFVLPNAFIGFGGDLRLGRRLRVGASLRIHTMAHFSHEPDTAMDIEPELAAQGQFYAKFDL